MPQPITQPPVAIAAPSAPERPAGPRGRGPKVRAAVLAAALAELAERGCAALTVEGVARRAGVHKTTVYRRWPDRESLVVDALTDLIAVEVPVPDSGDVATDLRALARALVRWLTSPSGQAVLAAVVSDTLRVPEVAAVKRRFFEDRFRRAEPVVARAVARGELPPGTDPAEVVKALIAPIYLRLLITAEPIDEGTADRAAQVALAAARAGALRAPGPAAQP
jgi:AcrR family transcriptional regulator